MEVADPNHPEGCQTEHGEECILSVYHPDAAELYDTTTSLSGVGYSVYWFKSLDQLAVLRECY